MAKNWKPSETTAAIADQKMIPEESVVSKLLRERLPTVYDQYKFVTEVQNKDLPPWKHSTKRPKWATERYFRGVMEDKYFSLTKDLVKEPVKVIRDKTKGELREILEECSGKDLGFEIDCEPKKKWLVKMVYSVKQDHEMFKPAEDEIKTVIPEK